MAIAERVTSPRASGWGWLVANPTYQAFSRLAFGGERRRLILLGLVPVVWLLAAHLGPITQMLRFSFYSEYPLTAGREAVFTLSHYGAFLTERIYLVPFFRTMVFAFAVTAITLVIVYPVAYFIAKRAPASRQVRYLLILLVPFWVSYIIRTFAIMVVLGNRGFLNLVLQNVGLIEEPIPFMYTYFSLGTGVLYLSVLYMLLPLYAAIEKIDDNLLEASADLGAGPLRRFWRITLPLSKDGIASGCTLVFLLATGYYAVPLLLGGPGTTLFAETIGNFFHVAGDRWPVGAAFALIMLTSSLLLVLLFYRLLGSKGAKLMS
ncbi:MAG: ABC transporter permease [Pseudomonadota bacterium]